MASGRYVDKKVLQNDEEIYEEALEERGVPHIRHYGTANLRHPTPEERAKLERVGHVWSVGDRFYKLAHKYYGDSRYWWVIAWYNKKPTESHLSTGDVIKVPLPLYKVLGFMRNE